MHIRPCHHILFGIHHLDEVEVEARSLGYGLQSVTATVTANQATTVDFSLTVSAIELEEIVATGTLVAARRRELGNAVTSLETDQIVASGAGRADLANLAMAGRARVRLDLEDFAGAISDAASIPDGFAHGATRDQSDARRYNTHCEMVNCDIWRHASVADNYRELTIGTAGAATEGDGVPDTRVNVTTDGEVGFDFATVWWYHDKITSRDDPVHMGSYREAQLVLAEASARSGDTDAARAAINRLRAAAGLPSFDAPATRDEMIAAAIEERRREMFVEGAHRFNDMLRFRGTAFEIPFLGDPGSIHPNGFDQTGTPYSDATCFPLPEVETGSNPNIS